VADPHDPLIVHTVYDTALQVGGLLLV
jgi:hypothetical protein